MIRFKIGSRAPWDFIGIGLSSVCIIHCILIPVALVFLPLTSLVYHLDKGIHAIFLFLIIPAVLFSIYSAKEVNKAALLLFSGLSLLVLAWGMHELTGWLPEIVLTLLGSGLLIAGHAVNYMHHQAKSNTIRSFKTDHNQTKGRG